MKPDFCTSLNANCTHFKYCPKCSHAIYRGRARLTSGGRLYRWEFSPQYGPVFSRRARGDCNWIPGQRHPVWKAFSEWRARKFERADQ